MDIDLLYTVFPSSVAQGMPKYSPEQSCLYIPGLGKLRMIRLSDFDFFRICVAVFPRTPPRRVIKMRGSEKEDTDSRERLFPSIERDKSVAQLIKYCRDIITPGSVVFTAETLVEGDIVTLHFLEAFYDDLHSAEKPQGILESVLNGKVCVSVKCKNKGILATIKQELPYVFESHRRSASSRDHVRSYC